MFVPNTTSSGEQPRKRPASARARSRISSTRRPVSYGAPRLADASRSARAIASPTSSGTCEPPGASRNAKPPWSEEKRRRTASTSSSVAFMERAYLGETGVRVSRIILGCGNFGGVGSAPAFFGRGETREEAFAVMDAAWEAGITTFDTADAYGGGRSESWIGDWLRAKGPEVRDADRALDEDVQPDGRGRGSRSRAGARTTAAREQPSPPRGRARRHVSRPRLGSRRAGRRDARRVRRARGAPGRSARSARATSTAPSCAQALDASATQGLVRFEWVQNSYSLLDREPEQEVLPLCAERGLGFTPFSPLGGGWLDGQVPAWRGRAAGLADDDAPGAVSGYRLDDDAVWRGLDGLAAAAGERGTTPAALALAWLLAEPGVTGVVVGPRRPEHLGPPIDALELGVDGDALDRIEAAFAVS